MNKISYEELIDGLNSRKIVYVNFSVEGYSHYRNCEIIIEGMAFYFGSADTIQIYLAKGEYTGFLTTFEENVKLFDFGRKGRYTLKQIWNRIEIREIKYAEKIDLNKF